MPLDAPVLSKDDEIGRRQLARAQDHAALVVFTEGERGGGYRERSGASGRWAAVRPPEEPVDPYGCGDSFAAGLTYGLDIADALALAARCGTTCLTGRGPYERQLRGREL